MPIPYGLISEDWLTDGLGGSRTTEASLRGDAWQTDLHPVRNINGPDFLHPDMEFDCTANEEKTGYIRGLGNVIVLNGFTENDPNYSIELFTAADAGGDRLVKYYGNMSCCYGCAQYAWQAALLFDPMQDGNIYYKFTNLLSTAKRFVLKMHAFRLR